MNTLYKKSLGCVLTRIDDSFVILQGSEIYRLNEVGARIYDLCDGNNSKKDIVEKLAKFYDGDRMEIVRDVDEFIKELWDLQVIEVKK